MLQQIDTNILDPPVESLMAELHYVEDLYSHNLPERRVRELYRYADPRMQERSLAIMSQHSFGYP